MNFNEIQELIRMVGKHKISEFVLREGDFKLVIRNQAAPEAAAAHVILPAQQPMVTMPTAQQAAPAEAPKAEPAPLPAEKPAAPVADENTARYDSIKSPMVGTFYRSTSNDKPPFVKVGDAVEPGNPVCIIEAMKLFNEIESDIKGKIIKVFVNDASPVEYDQPLFLVDPT